MNRTKSILLAATALTLLGAAGQAGAQTAPTPTVVFLPAPQGASSPNTQPLSISADGTTVIGKAGDKFVRWVNGVPAFLGTFANGDSLSDFSFSGVASADGSTVIGERQRRNFEGGGGFDPGANPYLWSSRTGLIDLPYSINGNEVVDGPYGLNYDGSVAILNTQQTIGPVNVARAYRWTATAGFQSLGQFAAPTDNPDYYGILATTISGDGNVIAGNTINLRFATVSGIDRDAQGGFVWTASSGLAHLPFLSASPANGATLPYAEVAAVSRDGTTIVGGSRGADGLSQAVYWRGGTITGLGFVPGASPASSETVAIGASANGNVIVGGAANGWGWRWTATSGMQDLNLLATNAGINLGGFTLGAAGRVSDDGRVILGVAENAQSQSRGYVFQTTALPVVPAPVMGVSFLPSVSAGTASCQLNARTNTFAQTISADGQTIVGQANSDCLAIWRNASPGLLNDPSQLQISRLGINLATGMSADGSVVVGTESSFPTRTVIWTAATGSYRPPEPIPGQRAAFGEGYVSSDGTLFAFNTLAYTVLAGGQSINATSAPARVYRWSVANGFEDIGSLGAQYRMIAHGISGAGNTIVGTAVVDATITAPNGQESAAFVWRSGSGLSALPQLVTTSQGAPYLPYAEANGISRDGSTIVGASRGANGLVQATYWQSGAATGLGFLPGRTPASADAYTENTTRAYAANADGSIIVGSVKGTAAETAWRWSATSGMQDINLIATNAGLNLNGFVLNNAVGVSDNGQFITGNSFNAAQSEYRGYVLSIAAAPPLPTTLSTTARLIVTLTLPGVTQTSIVNQNFSTQVDGLLNGRNVFTRTVADQITGSLGVTALADARTALQVGGGLRRLVIGAPVLISNTTTVQSSTSNTVNIASGTQQTPAAVVTNGPATVATGDLGTCATAATNGVNPTGCSLPGTPVTVNTNVINTNTFTNTINSVTPTTTTTVNQLVSARWQVSATAGNQFGTVHALVGPVAFERGDRLIGQLIDLGGAGGAAPVTRAAVGGSGLTMFGGYFGNWASIDADARVPVAQVRGNTDGFVLGLEKVLGDARIGVAVDHGTSSYDVRDATYPETLSMKHTQVGLFANWKSGGFALDGAAAYGLGTVRTTLTTPTTPATATRDVRSWSLGAQAGYGFDIDATRITLVAGLRHTSAKLNAFTEAGGPTPLTGLAKTVQRTRVYGGVEVATRIDLGGITLTPRVHARVASDSGDASGTADLIFASAPTGPTLRAVGPGVGRTVAELGGSLDAAVGGNVHLWLGYDGSFLNGAKSHSAKAGMTVAF